MEIVPAAPASPGSVTSPIADRIASDPPGLAAVNVVSLSSGPVITRGRRTRPVAPISTTEVRRSNHSNKYNGFKTQQVTDTLPVISRVKPRLAPSIGSSSKVAPQDEILPPTPVAVLQDIGINRCAIPPAELSEEIHNASPLPVQSTSQEMATDSLEPQGESAASRA